MIAAAAVVVLAVGGFGVWKAMSGASVQTDSNGNVPAATPTGTPAPLVAPIALPLSRRFEIFDSMANAGAPSAQAVMDSLRAIDAIAQATDSDLVRLRWIRVQANVTLSNFAPACTELRNIENRAQSTRFKDAVNNLLKSC